MSQKSTIPTIPVEKHTTDGRSIRPFYTKSSFLSNFYECSIQLDDHEFSCTEQIFMWRKAKLFKDEEIAEEILKITNPMEMKKLGQRVNNFDD